MDLIRALRSNRPIRRPLAKFTGSNGDGWVSCELIKGDLLGSKSGGLFGTKIESLITEDDLLATDWEVKPEPEESKTFTRIEVNLAIREAARSMDRSFAMGSQQQRIPSWFPDEVLKALGFKAPKFY